MRAERPFSGAQTGVTVEELIPVNPHIIPSFKITYIGRYELALLFPSFILEPDATGEQTPPIRIRQIERVMQESPEVAQFLRRLGIEESIARARRAKELGIPRRQLEVLELAVLGLASTEIGKELGKSEYTIRNQLHITFKKLEVNTRTQALISAVEEGLFSPFSLEAELRRRSSVDRTGLIKLSPREEDVLANLAEGKTAVEVGETLLIEPQTVKNHKANIFGKLGVSNSTQAVLLFLAGQKAQAIYGEPPKSEPDPSRLTREERRRAPTVQQREALALRARGASVAEIAEELTLKRHAVYNLLSRAYKKLGVNNLSGALTRAINLGYPELTSLIDEFAESLEVERFNQLNAHELEMLDLLASGKKDKEIGHELGITSYTVNNRLRKIYKMLAVKNRIEATLHYLAYQKAAGEIED